MKAVLTDHMGDDLKVVNAARASFAKKVDTLGPKEVNLIKYLARGIPSGDLDKLMDEINECSNEQDDTGVLAVMNRYRGVSTHWVPFAHCHMTFEIEMPIIVARQLIRTTVGVAISEMSRRYVDEEPDYWLPEQNGWRLRAENVKQGSSSECLGGTDLDIWLRRVDDHLKSSTELYNDAIKLYKIAPELARMILPQNANTTWTWTVSLVTFARVMHQRLDSHAQKEIRDLAKLMYDQAIEKFPISLKALMDYGA